MVQILSDLLVVKVVVVCTSAVAAIVTAGVVSESVPVLSTAIPDCETVSVLCVRSDCTPKGILSAFTACIFLSLSSSVVSSLFLFGSGSSNFSFSPTCASDTSLPPSCDAIP